MQATAERPTRRAYFAGLMFKTVATVAVSGASSLVAPPGLSYAYAYDENASRWQPEVIEAGSSSRTILILICLICFTRDESV